jgi:hypothetical protein
VSIATVVTRGFGSGGSIAGLVLRGFGQGEVVPVSADYMLADIALVPVDDSLCIGNDHVLSVTLMDGDETPITSGTVELTVTDMFGQEVAGIAQPIAFEHQGSGVWLATIDAAAEFQNLQRYRLSITADSGELDGAWRQTLPARYRRFDQ